MNSYAKSYAKAISSLEINEIGQMTDLDGVCPKNGGKLSLGLECLDRDLWDFHRAFPEIVKTGVKKVRLQSGWQKTEKIKGVYDFAWLDNIVDKLLAQKVEIVLCLCYGNKLYCENPENFPSIENGGVGHFPTETEEARTGWINYVKATVNHYGEKIGFYEIWNEIDVSVFAKIDRSWDIAYMDLVKITSPVIRELAPGSKIMSCTANMFRTKILVDLGIANYVDIHSFHAYRFYPEEIPTEAVANFLSQIRNKAPNLKFYRGESGCPSYNDPKSKGALSDVVATEPKQAKFLLRHLLSDIANDLIDCTSYFHAYDFVHFSGIVRYHYGLVRHEDLSRKPSYHCFQMLTHLFAGEVKKIHNRQMSAFVRKNVSTINESELASVKFVSLEVNEDPVYAYYLPKEIDDEIVAKTIALMPPADLGLDDPVIVDPLTRRIYQADFTLENQNPITDYPLFIVDRKYLEGISVIGNTQNNSLPELSKEQSDHE